MSVKKMYLLDTGAIVASKNSVTGGSLEDMSEVLNMPCEVFLLETDEGYVLYDTGTHPEANKGHWNPVLSKLFPFKQTPEQRLEAQLALCGVKPEDIKTVVLSHFHCDHTGGLYLFPHADVYVPAEDFKLAMANIHSTGVIRGAYTREDIELTFNSMMINEPAHIFWPPAGSFDIIKRVCFFTDNPAHEISPKVAVSIENMESFCYNFSVGEASAPEVRRQRAS